MALAADFPEDTASELHTHLPFGEMASAPEVMKTLPSANSRCGGSAGKPSGGTDDRA
jgi:hypothetical protein